MAANVCDINVNTVALVAATAKTAMGILAPSNIALKVSEVSISFDGATSSNAPAIAELCFNTFATNAPGTNSTSVTPTKRDQGRDETVQTTAAKNWTAEPTVITVYRTIDVPQFDGLYHVLIPALSPYIIPGAKGFSVRLTSPNNVNFSGNITFEE